MRVVGAVGMWGWGVFESDGGVFEPRAKGLEGVQG